MEDNKGSIDYLDSLILSVTCIYWEACGEYNALLTTQIDLEERVRLAEEKMKKERNRLENLKHERKENLKHERNKIQNISGSV